MYIHAFKIVVRTLLRHRSHTALNVSGLAIGLAACLLTLLYIKEEWTYDTHHEHASEIFRVINGINARTPGSVAISLNDYFPEVASSVRMRATRAIWLMQHGDRAFYEDEVYWAEPSLFDVFTILLIKGNPETALEGNNKAVISESMAKKYFGDKDPIDQVLRADDTFNFTVTGVMRDFPTHSHFKAGVFLSIPYNELNSMNNWFNATYYTYVRLHDQHLASDLEVKFRSYVDNEVKPANQGFIQDYEFTLQPLTSIHLHSRLLNELAVNSSMAYLYTLVSGVAFLLLIASINFINFSLLHSAARAKEAGLMQVFGADRFAILRQHLSGYLLITGFVLVLALLLAYLALPVFNGITGKKLNVGLAQHVDVWLGLICIAAFVGVVSGGLPALILSGSSPLNTLQKQLGNTFDYPFVKQVLITLQFTLSIILIISTGVVYNQLGFMLSAPQGFDKTDVIVTPLILAFFGQGQERRSSKGFQEELLRSPHISSVSLSDYVPGLAPGRGTIGEGMVRRGDGDYVQSSRSSRLIHVEHGYLETLRMDLVRGSFLKEKELLTVYDPTVTLDVVLNETAVQHLGWPSAESAIDQIVEVVYPWASSRFRIIGVVRDTHFRSLFQPVEPMLFSNGIGEHMTIRIHLENTAGALADLDKTWQAHYPDIPLVYSFLEEDINRLYDPENRLGTLLGICALLAIVLTFLGLFNLVSLTVHQRTKEIGVRKILGATRAQLVQLLSKEFLIMAIAGSVIAWPIAYLVMDSWLRDFAYRIAPSPALFVLVGLAVLAVAASTVGLHVLKAARSNPVEALRYE